MSENNDLELIGTALQNFDKVGAGLALLEKNYKGMLYEVDTALGLEHAKAARSAIREPRYEVERIRKSAKAPLLALGKRLDSEATRITNALLTLENPIDEQIKAEEDRKEREKQAKIESEAKRIAAIQLRIDSIRAWPVQATGKPSSLIRQQLASANDYVIDPDFFQEKSGEAQTVLDTSRVALSGIYVERVAYEDEQERLKAERAELLRLRAEQEARDKTARDAQVAEARAHAQKLAEDRAENERISRQRQSDLDRQAEEQRQANAREVARIAAEREAFEKTQHREPKPQKTTPRRAEILEVIANHYGVTIQIAEKWMSMIDWDLVN